MSRITTYLVGRDPRCDYRIDDASVSRRHAEVVPASGGRLYVTDCASTGGTFLLRGGREWERIRQAWVGPADRIRFGGYEMRAADLAGLCGGGGVGTAPPGPVPDPAPVPPVPAPVPPAPAPAPPVPAPVPPAPVREEKKRPVRDPRTGEIVESQDDQGSAR